MVACYARTPNCYQHFACALAAIPSIDATASRANTNTLKTGAPALKTGANTLMTRAAALKTGATALMTGAGTLRANARAVLAAAWARTTVNPA